MSRLYVTLTIPYVWQLRDYPHIKITRDLMLINKKTGRLLKYNTRGYYIDGKYYKKKDIRKMAEKPKKEFLPF